MMLPGRRRINWWARFDWHELVMGIHWELFLQRALGNSDYRKCLRLRICPLPTVVIAVILRGPIRRGAE